MWISAEPGIASKFCANRKEHDAKARKWTNDYAVPKISGTAPGASVFTKEGMSDALGSGAVRRPRPIIVPNQEIIVLTDGEEGPDTSELEALAPAFKRRRILEDKDYVPGVEI